MLDPEMDESADWPRSRFLSLMYLGAGTIAKMPDLVENIAGLRQSDFLTLFKAHAYTPDRSLKCKLLGGALVSMGDLRRRMHTGKSVTRKLQAKP